MVAIVEHAKDWVVETSRKVKAVYADRVQLLVTFVNLAMIVFSALMMWKGAQLYTGSECPVVVVLSGSMEPAFYRGDIVFLDLDTSSPMHVGEVIVYSLEGRDIPIVHRIIEVHENSTAADDFRILTKGDNNRVDDRGLYNRGQLWLRPKEVMGRGKAFLPYVGMFTIWLNENPMFKYLVLGSMALMVIANKEES